MRSIEQTLIDISIGNDVAYVTAEESEHHDGTPLRLVSIEAPDCPTLWPDEARALAAALIKAANACDAADRSDRSDPAGGDSDAA